MRNIGAGPITNGGGTVALPKAAIEMLPGSSNIIKYLEANYPNVDIIHISHSYSKNLNDISEEVNLTTPTLKYLVFNRATGEFIKEWDAVVK